MMRLIDRDAPRSQSQIMPQILCFLVSSIWHGLELGLFACMFGLGLVLALYKTTVNTVICATISKNVPFVIYHPFKWFFFYYLACYYEICFELRYFSVFTAVHATMYHVGTWLPWLIMIVASFLPKVRRPRAAADKVKTQEATSANDTSSKADKKRD